MTAAWRAAWCLAIAAPALSGCALSREDPPAMASAQPLPERWVLAPPGETAVPLDRYWTMLEDPLVTFKAHEKHAEAIVAGLTCAG